MCSAFFVDGVSPRKARSPFCFTTRRTGWSSFRSWVGGPGGHKALANKEELAENLRLLYVALTRAKCGVSGVGRFKGAETSAPAYLLHTPATEDSGDLVKALADTSNESRTRNFSSSQVSDEEACSAVEVIREIEDDEALFSAAEEMQINPAKEFAGRIDRQWRISSFSGLVSDRLHSEEGPTTMLSRCRLGRSLRTMEEPAGIFAFPKGAKAALSS